MLEEEPYKSDIKLFEDIESTVGIAVNGTASIYEKIISPNSAANFVINERFSSPNKECMVPAVMLSCHTIMKELDIKQAKYFSK